MKSCKQCGTCCRSGGPALHLEDYHLLKKNIITLDKLITIRVGEPVYSPINNKIEPAKEEFLKVSATNSWVCPYLNSSSNSCTIYQNRPVECRLLQCWDTAAIINVIYKDNLGRWDIISSSQPIFSYLKTYDIECDYDKIALLAERAGDEKSIKYREQIEEITAKDAAIRKMAIEKFSLHLQEELLYFGRPMFMSLKYWGLNLT